VVFTQGARLALGWLHNLDANVLELASNSTTSSMDAHVQQQQQQGAFQSAAAWHMHNVHAHLTLRDLHGTWHVASNNKTHSPTCTLVGGPHVRT
jgi:hypothetical protein